MKFYAQSRCSLEEISEKPSWKLENVVSTIYKIISNINIVYLHFFTTDDVLLGKVTISASLKKIVFQRFRKISEQAPLINFEITNNKKWCSIGETLFPIGHATQW